MGYRDKKMKKAIYLTNEELRRKQAR